MPRRIRALSPGSAPAAGWMTLLMYAALATHGAARAQGATTPAPAPPPDPAAVEEARPVALRIEELEERITVGLISALP